MGHRIGVQVQTRNHSGNLRVSQSGVCACTYVFILLESTFSRLPTMPYIPFRISFSLLLKLSNCANYTKLSAKLALTLTNCKPASIYSHPSPRPIYVRSRFRSNTAPILPWNLHFDFTFDGVGISRSTYVEVHGVCIAKVQLQMSWLSSCSYVLWRLFERRVCGPDKASLASSHLRPTYSGWPDSSGWRPQFD
jgi:hypothetical protein